MLKQMYLFFIGYVSFVIPSADKKKLTADAFDRGIYVRICKPRRGKCRVSVRLPDFDAVMKTCNDAGICIENVKHYGIPTIFRKYGKRYGIIAGVAVLAAALFLSDDYVWRIEVSGNETVSDEEIKRELAELGFCEGARISDIDFDKLHNRFLADSDSISWIAVNMHGSIAYTEVREYLPGENPNDGGCANIIAGEGGVITQISPFEGRGEVSIGDKVEKGQLLISGVVDYGPGGVRFVRADGDVFAEVEREICVSIPYHESISVETGDKPTVYGIKIFSSEYFFGSKGRIDGDIYDTMTTYGDIGIPGAPPLPIRLIRLEGVRYGSITVTRTKDEARALAYAEYKREFREATENAALLSYETESRDAGDAYEIRCRLRVITNIAVPLEFSAG